MPQISSEQIHIDFVTEIPEDNAYKTIMICIDCFSKMVVLVPLQESDAQTVSSRFLAAFVSLQRFPATIISDREPRFQ